MLKSLFKSKPTKDTPINLIHEEFFNSLRKKEYHRLDKDKHVYLDYTGGNLYSETQLEQHFKLLKENTFGNPHSTNPTSKYATKLVEEARQKVINFFNANDYYCVFTPNASGALQIVGESYPFEENGNLLLLADNHNSVNGIREYCLKAGGKYDCTPMNYNDLSISKETLQEKLSNSNCQNKLLAFPAQSNVSGIKHDLNWIEEAKGLGWDVLLDAAAFVPTNTLDLSLYKPDFVSISFYKIFGYPTGLGCLLIKKSTFTKLKKRWFAGGTVSLASALTPYHFLIDNHERFENGTLNYLDIPALKIGIEYIEKIGMQRIKERVDSLMNYLHFHLKELKHSNGQNQLVIYGHPERKNTGGTAIMCFFNPDGTKIKFEKIEELANSKNISIRSGCFCNPGIDEINNELTKEEMTTYFTSRETGNYKEMEDFLKKMRGATRVSVGIATNKADLDAMISLITNLKDQKL